jgi:transcriptional regulator of aromatic amino acid metabolism
MVPFLTLGGPAAADEVGGIQIHSPFVVDFDGSFEILQVTAEPMYPLDRRLLAQHVYSLVPSLRRTAVLLKVSHTTVARWLGQPQRKA